MNIPLSLGVALEAYLIIMTIKLVLAEVPTMAITIGLIGLAGMTRDDLLRE